MAKKSTVILCIINIFGLIFTITTMVLTNKISDETKEDPLEEYDKKIKNFLDEDDDETDKTKDSILEVSVLVSDELSKLSKYCQCGEKILENICTEEQISSGCNDIFENNKSTFLRYLEVNCDSIGIKIVNKGGFSKAFGLNYGAVYRMATGIYIVLIVLAIFLRLITLVVLFRANFIILSTQN